MLDEKDILSLEAHLQAEHLADLAAIRRVQRLLGVSKIAAANNGIPDARIKQVVAPAPLTPVHHPELPAIASNGTTVESKVLHVLSNIDGEFKMEDLLLALKETFPGQEINPKSVSGVLFRHKDKTIKVVKSGRGRRRAVYLKI